MNLRTCLGLGLLLASFPALAVDLRNDMWSGLYAGVKAGYGTGDVKSGEGKYDPAFPFSPSSMNIDGTGLRSGPTPLNNQARSDKCIPAS